MFDSLKCICEQQLCNMYVNTNGYSCALQFSIVPYLTNYNVFYGKYTTILIRIRPRFPQVPGHILSCSVGFTKIDKVLFSVKHGNTIAGTNPNLEPYIKLRQRLWLRLGVNVDDHLWLRLNPIPIPNCNPSVNPSPSRNTNTNPNPNPNRPTTPLLTLTDPLTCK